MWSTESLQKINEIASDLAKQGKPERDAIFVFTDARVRKQYEKDGVVPLTAQKIK